MNEVAAVGVIGFCGVGKGILRSACATSGSTLMNGCTRDKKRKEPDMAGGLFGNGVGAPGERALEGGSGWTEQKEKIRAARWRPDLVDLSQYKV